MYNWLSQWYREKKIIIIIIIIVIIMINEYFYNTVWYLYVMLCFILFVK